jgi:adenylosuccinate synthase
VGDEGKGKIVDVLTSKYDILLVFKEVRAGTYFRI